MLYKKVIKNTSVEAKYHYEILWPSTLKLPLKMIVNYWYPGGNYHCFSTTISYLLNGKHLNMVVNKAFILAENTDNR